MSKEIREYINKFRQFINENYNDEYNKALKDVSVLIPLISHEIIHEKGLEHTEENMVNINREIKQKVNSGDDYVLDKMWDLAGSTVLRHAINVITYYHKDKTMDKFKTFILKESTNNNFDENRKSIRRYIKIMTKSDEYQAGYRIDDGGHDDGRYQKKYNIYDHWVKYLIIIHNSLLIEEKFQNEFKVSGKEINRYLKLPNTTNFNEIIKLSRDYYDSSNKVRFGIETKDSIEEVRIYLKELSDRGIKFYDKIYFSF